MTFKGIESDCDIMIESMTDSLQSLGILKSDVAVNDNSIEKWKNGILTKEQLDAERKKQIYREQNRILNEILSARFEEINGFDYYKDIFPNNETAAESGTNHDFSKPNSIFIYWDSVESEHPHRRIMFKDTWEDDFIDYVENSARAFCSGCSFRGRSNRIEHAQKAHAIIIDLDYVGEKELNNLFLVLGKPRVKNKRINFDREMPMPTYIVCSGTGLHIVYVFDIPLDLYPDVKQQAYRLKRALTVRLWNLGITTKAKNPKEIQKQSIVHQYRMVGSFNSKYGVLVRAYKTGDKVPYTLLNDYVDEQDQVHYKEFTKGGTYHESFGSKWDVKPDVYQWWLKRASEAVPGHRFYFMLVAVAYAKKCNISFKTVKQDLYDIFDTLAAIAHDNPLTVKDVKSALRAYQRPYFHLLSIDKIIDLTQVVIHKNKRNGRKRDIHLALNRDRKFSLKKLGQLKAPDGRPSKQIEVEEFIKQNPNATVKDIVENVGVTAPTARKYLNNKRVTVRIVEEYLKQNPDVKKFEMAKALSISRPTLNKFLKIIAERQRTEIEQKEQLKKDAFEIQKKILEEVKKLADAYGVDIATMQQMIENK